MPSRSEDVLYVGHPAMFRSHPLGFIIACMLIPFGIGILILLRWWIREAGTTLTVTSQRTSLRKGILSRDVSEVLNANVRNVQVKQSMGQRMFGVGYIAVSSSGQSDLEIEVDGIRDPMAVKRLIDSRGVTNELPPPRFDLAGPLVMFGSVAVSCFFTSVIYFAIAEAAKQ